MSRPGPPTRSPRTHAQIRSATFARSARASQLLRSGYLVNLGWRVSGRATWTDRFSHARLRPSDDLRRQCDARCVHQVRRCFPLLGFKRCDVSSQRVDTSFSCEEVVDRCELSVVSPLHAIPCFSFCWRLTSSRHSRSPVVEPADSERRRSLNPQQAHEPADRYNESCDHPQYARPVERPNRSETPPSPAISRRTDAPGVLHRRFGAELC